MRAAGLAIVMLSLTAASGGARDAEDAKNLSIGLWEITYSDAKDDVPVGTRMEFTHEGKILVTVKSNGSEKTVDAGGYKLDRDYIILTGKDGNKNDKGRICLLNKSTFIINDELEDKVMVLKRVKPK